MSGIETANPGRVRIRSTRTARAHGAARTASDIRDPRKAWESACKAAGLPGLLIHDLRRSAVRNMEQAGVPRSVAMKLTGHKTENVYRRYAIVSDAALESAAQKLSAASTGR